MSMNLKMMIMGVVLLAAALKTEAAEPNPNNRLQCWHCSSDTVGAEEFCGEVFNEDNIPVDLLKERNLSVLRACNSSIKSEHERPVCRKTVEEINGQTVTKRFCYYTNKSDTLTHCMDDPTEKNVHRVFCEDCLTEKCNGAIAVGGNYLGLLSCAVTLLIIFVSKHVNV
ncbi:target of wit [Musca autumnalis]|uniref:target of wit n=1 Tax=Musca autumnalis TaxID=221902 RepID=UPI003CF7E2CC